MDITFSNKRKIKPDPELIEETKKKKQRFYELEDKRLERELNDWDF